MLGRAPLAGAGGPTRIAVAVQPVGVPACGLGADLEIAAWALAPCVMIAPPLMSCGVAPEHEAVDAVDSVKSSEFPVNVPAAGEVTTVNVPIAPEGPLGPLGAGRTGRTAGAAWAAGAGLDRTDRWGRRAGPLGPEAPGGPLGL